MLIPHQLSFLNKFRVSEYNSNLIPLRLQENYKNVDDISSLYKSILTLY
jgi:hypothetical protein